MIKPTLELVEFLLSLSTFLTTLAIYTALAIVLAKSIKKHAKVYYWIVGIISFAFLIPFTARFCGATLPFDLGQIPLLGQAADEMSHAGWFVHPVIVIIMYMGALNIKRPNVGRLMSIRKELSILVGFPVLAHGIKRILTKIPEAWNYYANHEEFMQSPRVVSDLASGISSFVYMLGIVMFILFLVLWITSFDGVRRKMGSQKWKSVQRWSYGLYAMLFIHSLGLSASGIISTNARAAQQHEQVAVVAPAPVADRSGHPEGAEQRQRPEGAEQRQRPEGAEQHQRPEGAEGRESVEQSHGSHGSHATTPSEPQPQRARPKKAFSLVDDVEVSGLAKRWINIVALFMVYGSYLYLRVRKHRNSKARKQQR